MRSSADDASMIGIQVSFLCAVCGRREKTHQLQSLRNPIALMLPRGWALVGKATYCGGEQIAGAEVEHVPASLAA